ncbi:ABC transporter permease subunit [Leptolyngbya sp. FACHB-17]|uniref:ABC transporter permease n=1 Tax=unclassified Leptolyngbya TaxID=2650499 RepID=UPI001680CEDB|nr:ABC transporter permease subunit [Leptolyngbya sp. FACHB-17]MBD2079164.1 ABC transporter permease subunit [Leptolyngbya sp. FACHB-17]
MSQAVQTVGGTVMRIQAIAANVFREVIRDRVLYLIGLYGAGLLLAGRLLPEVAAATEAKILLDLALAAMPVFGLIVAIFIGTGLVNKEIEKRTVFVLIAKPVSRAEFIIGKHLGLSAVLAVLITAMTVSAIAILSLFKTPFPLANLLLSSIFLWLQLSLVSAIALLFSVFASALLAMMLTFGIYLIGQLSQDLVQFGRLTKNPAIETATQGLYLVLPDLARLDLKNQAVYNLIPAAPTLFASVLYALLYITLTLAIASLIFSRREF